VIVNRGWVPLEFDTPPVAASPPEGVVEIAGLARLGQTRSGVGPTDPPGARVVSRVDLEHLAASVDGPLAPVWLQASVPDGDLPIPVPEPDVADPGPHLSYAIQWFAFALIGVVGYGALVRSHAHRGQVGARRMEVA
jgi:surfeit locus 1 family protein